VLTWATVPTGALLLALFGLAHSVKRDLSRLNRPVPGDTPNQPVPEDTPASRPAPKDTSPAAPRWTAPLPGPPRDGLLLAIFSIFPLALIALPTIPIFGGTKHWLTAYPFLALAATLGFVTLARAVADTPPSSPLLHRHRHRLPAVALVLILVPGLWSTIDGHPHGLAQYAPLIGGPRGAADSGMLRNFWGHSVPSSLLHPDGAAGPFYLHDLHGLSRLQYEREGRWPVDAPPSAPSRARAGLLFHERHMLSNELELWQSLGPVPAEVVTLDDVPLTSLYRDTRGP